MFVDLLPVRTAELKRAAAAGDMAAIRAIAHLINGSAGCLGLSGIGTQAKQLEVAALNGHIATVHDEVAKLLDCCSDYDTAVTDDWRAN